MTPEGKVKAKVKRILDGRDVYHFSPVTGGYGASGVPDIIGCYYGVFLAVECKAGNGKLTLLQDRAITRIVENGGVALVINETNYDDLTSVLDAIERKRDE